MIVLLLLIAFMTIVNCDIVINHDLRNQQI